MDSKPMYLLLMCLLVNSSCADVSAKTFALPHDASALLQSATSVKRSNIPTDFFEDAVLPGQSNQLLQKLTAPFDVGSGAVSTPQRFHPVVSALQTGLQRGATSLSLTESAAGGGWSQQPPHQVLSGLPLGAERPRTMLEQAFELADNTEKRVKVDADNIARQPLVELVTEKMVTESPQAAMLQDVPAAAGLPQQQASRLDGTEQQHSQEPEEYEMPGMSAAFVECVADGESDCMHLDVSASPLAQAEVQSNNQQKHVKLSQQQASLQANRKRQAPVQQPSGQVVDHVDAFDRRQQLIEIQRKALEEKAHDSLRMLGKALEKQPTPGFGETVAGPPELLSPARASGQDYGKQPSGQVVDHANALNQRQQLIELQRRAVEAKKYDSSRMLGRALEKQPTTGFAETLASLPKLLTPAIEQSMNLAGNFAKRLEPAREGLWNAVQRQVPFLSNARSQLSSAVTQQRSSADQASKHEDLSLEEVSRRLVEDEKRILTALIAKKKAISTQSNSPYSSSMLASQVAVPQYPQPGPDQYAMGYSSGVAPLPNQFLNREDYEFSQPVRR